VAVSREDPGASGNPGFSSRVRGAISISGGLIDRDGIKRGDAPMLLVHGDADAVVPIGASEAVCAAARDADVGCELVTIPGADHYVPYRRFDEVVGVTADWVRDRL
jgi:fermentation-respiration switch protein FrsA (DUF1100 family)